MKHPVLCTLFTLFLTLTTAQPFVASYATELWNSQKKSNSGGKTYYYNKSKSSTSGNVTLYNTTTPPAYNTSKNGGLKQTLQGYQKVEVSGQHSSKLWGLMSPSALANRQADIEHALQVEYDTRKITAAHITTVFKEVQTAQMKADKEYQNTLSEYQQKKQAEELAAQQKKEQALNGGTSHRKKTYSASGSGKKKLYVTSKESTETNTKLKKPKRLFNDPNR
tara:strand:+ start:28696 stop:29361 length:666 start_codon:yes stop_codon:yes gene_type:complete